MAAKLRPACLEILHVIAKQSEKTSTLFDKQSASFATLKKVARSSGTFTKNEDLLASPDAIHYVQLLLLVALSMHGGIFIPALLQLKPSESGLKIVWQNRLRSDFKWGVFDTSFSSFASDTMKLLGQPKQGSAAFFKSVQKILKKYLDSLEKTQKRIQMLQDLKQPPSKFSADALFILMSALNEEELNNLFLYLYQFFPEDLTIKSPNGHQIRICALFQTPTTDMIYLIEKVRIYFELYTSTQQPIIKEITQSQTRKFLLEAFRHPTQRASILANLKSLKDNQIDSRIRLYTIFDRHLTMLLKP